MGSYTDLQALKKKKKKEYKAVTVGWLCVHDERQDLNQKLCPTHML